MPIEPEKPKPTTLKEVLGPLLRELLSIVEETELPPSVIPPKVDEMLRKIEQKGGD